MLISYDLKYLEEKVKPKGGGRFICSKSTTETLEKGMTYFQNS